MPEPPAISSKRGNSAQIDGACRGLAEENAAAVHGGGKPLGVGIILHGHVPIVLPLLPAAPEYRLPSPHHFQQVDRSRPLLERGEIRTEKPGRRGNQMFLRDRRESQPTARVDEKLPRLEERYHDISQAGDEFEMTSAISELGTPRPSRGLRSTRTGRDAPAP